MRIRLMPALAAALAIAAIAKPATAAAEDGKRPNFLVIVADDLGFSDIGAFGGEIDTPNLDALAREGVRFTGFHTAPTCSPTRAMLLSGTDNHLAGVGTMAELIAPNQQGKPGYQGVLKPEVATLGNLLGAGGYRTLLSGKWHLGTTPDLNPHARGFQRSFALLQGGHNHFGLNASANPLGGATYTEDGKVLDGVPADFYSSDYFATKLLQFLGETDQDKPFFAYLAFTAPHWPLQAPPEDIARYRGRYDDGFEALRERRLQRQAELGLYDPSKPAHTIGLPEGGWNALTPEQKRTAARDMEIYAAMVDRLDKNVGRVIAELKRTGQYENTVILFLADNGAEGLDIATSETVGINRLDDGADNSFDNRGAGTSYLGYGPGWAAAATAPSWLYKAYATEGGTRVVSFLTHAGLGQPGSVAREFLSVADVAPTFLELAGLPDHDGRFQGRAVEPIRGKSWVSYLSGRADRVYAPDEPIGLELFASRSIRQGDWKITDIGDGTWRLFNLADDPGETRDLSTDEPARLTQLLAAWDEYAAEVGVILPDERLYTP